MTPEQIEQEALDVRRRTVMKAPPVPVYEIAKKLDIEVRDAVLGDDVSGLLVIEKGIPVIGVNSRHNKRRKRFTVAHEIGHYVLHLGVSDLFIDEGDFLAIYRRDDTRSRDNKRERDANTFAGALLMPKDLLYKELETARLDLFEDRDWKSLAERFDVSQQALMIRLTKLGYFGPAY